MNHNNPHNAQQSISGLENKHAVTDAFKRKLKLFIQDQLLNNPQYIKILRGGFGFALINNCTSAGTLDQLLDQTLNCSKEQLIREALLHGLRIKEVCKNNDANIMTFFIAKYKLIQSNIQDQQIQVSSQEEEDDEFPKQKEIQVVLKQKQLIEKPNFVKPNIILNKAYSQGHAGGISQTRKNDASIEVKLSEYQSPIIPGEAEKRKKIKQNSEEILYEQFDINVIDRLKSEKANYLKCSRLIDGTIIQLLQAQRGKKIEEKKQGLMEKIAQIYDLLSNSIENGSQLIRIAGEKDYMKPLQKPQDE